MGRAALGMAPSVDTRTALESRVDVEPDARVRLVMAYALVHHGVTELEIELRRMMDPADCGQMPLQASAA